ncbi:hypothetical protein [Polycladidibacter stylochi]|uniref:hypothetical protein n=1 Tax=Polycladidibacter stylochi TaxID=1807766 RepID=UPI0008366DF2|nr:hypothetical protein [Pseudovibrio stylochi]
MSSFSEEWLRLRFPADKKARNKRLDKLFSRHILRFCETQSTVRIHDLAAGSGASLKALLPHLVQCQEQLSWCFYDNDPKLLAVSKEIAQREALSISPIICDLNIPEFFQTHSLVPAVTSSAFFDLVSESWIELLATYLLGVGSTALFSLTIDGRYELSPPHAFDTQVMFAVRQHQQKNKGFGPALGCEAAAFMIECFNKVGFTVLTGQSDWLLDYHDNQLQQELIQGWYSAALQMGLGESTLEVWRAFRLAALSKQESKIMLGHCDILINPN